MVTNTRIFVIEGVKSSCDRVNGNQVSFVKQNLDRHPIALSYRFERWEGGLYVCCCVGMPWSHFASHDLVRLN